MRPSRRRLLCRPLCRAIWQMRPPRQPPLGCAPGPPRCRSPPLRATSAGVSILSPSSAAASGSQLRSSPSSSPKTTSLSQAFRADPRWVALGGLWSCYGGLRVALFGRGGLRAGPRWVVPRGGHAVAPPLYAGNAGWALDPQVRTPGAHGRAARRAVLLAARIGFCAARFRLRATLASPRWAASISSRALAGSRSAMRVRYTATPTRGPQARAGARVPPPGPGRPLGPGSIRAPVDGPPGRRSDYDILRNARLPPWSREARMSCGAFSFYFPFFLFFLSARWTLLVALGVGTPVTTSYVGRGCDPAIPQTQ